MSEALKCDQCGKVEPVYEAVNWITITGAGMTQLIAPGHPLYPATKGGLHFCSVDCLQKFAEAAGKKGARK